MQPRARLEHEQHRRGGAGQGSQSSGGATRHTRRCLTSGGASRGRHWPRGTSTSWAGWCRRPRLKATSACGGGPRSQQGGSRGRAALQRRANQRWRVRRAGAFQPLRPCHRQTAARRSAAQAAATVARRPRSRPCAGAQPRSPLQTPRCRRRRRSPRLPPHRRCQRQSRQQPQRSAVRQSSPRASAAAAPAARFCGCLRQRRLRALSCSVGGEG